MAGIAQKSGPPGNCNSVGNSGGKLGRSGPPGNGNAASHCVYAYLATGRLPKGAADIGRLMNSFRFELESAVRGKHGDVTLHAAALVQTACRHEARAQLLQRYLRVEPDLSLD